MIAGLFSLLGNPAGLQRAIEEATPNRAKVHEQQQRLKWMTDELDKLESSRQRVLDLVVSGTIEQKSADVPA